MSADQAAGGSGPQGGVPAAGVQLPPPPVGLEAKWPVESLMGAVDAIKEHRAQQEEEHKRQKEEAAAAQATQAGQQGTAAGAAHGDQAAAATKDDRPPGYPGTFFLEKPLTPEEAQTIPRMWGPPSGAPGYPPPQYGQPGSAAPSAPPYPPTGAPGYPPAGAPGYPPAGAPGYPPAGAPGYPPATANSGGYPPATANNGGYPPASANSGGYPPVHHAPAAPAASAYPRPGYPPAAAPAKQQQAAAPAGPPPAATGKKKAFIVGINYFGTSAQLNGCINDAKCMEYLLKTKFGFRQEQILMMTDDCPDPMRRPTRANMYQGFRWLMMDLRPGDSLVFHYSGHGSQQRDYSGEETDGMNETLCPLDFRSAGEIVDDELNRLLVNPLPTGVKLHCIIDACHSGSVMDLPFQAHVRGGYAQWEAAYHYTRSHKGTAGGFAVQFGAAKDSQTAADTKALSGNTATGAATYCFIQAIERRGTKLSYGELLLGMHHTLQATMGPAAQGPPMSGGGGLLGMLLGGSMMGAGGYRGQEPVLSANFAFDLAYPFTL